MFGLIKSITNLANTWITSKSEKSKAKQALELAEIDKKKEIILSLQKNTHEWELNSLQDKDKWLRRLSFLMFSSPFLIAIFAPEHVSHYFEVALQEVPVWWQKSYMAMTGGIWGIASLKNIIPEIIDVVKK
ncbi:MAG: hypothetical protein KDK05_29955 [Candidatus Competibacteraceae bacterium]|nr:hypothetical protein [Candidatus Competibacteraceae bacterium]